MFEALPRFRLVDVPGLGFARVSHELRERWIALIGGVALTRAHVMARISSLHNDSKASRIYVLDILDYD